MAYNFSATFFPAERMLNARIDKLDCGTWHNGLYARPGSWRRRCCGRGTWGNETRQGQVVLKLAGNCGAVLTDNDDNVDTVSGDVLANGVRPNGSVLGSVVAVEAILVINK